ncbi:MAG: hypothetical protein R2845_11710 [Thermomicrobiales bacterium]
MFPCSTPPPRSARLCSTTRAFDLTTATGNVVALDAWSGQILWDVELPTGLAGPGITIADDALHHRRPGRHSARVLDRRWFAALVTMAGAGRIEPYTLAIAGDLLLVPAATFFLPSSDTEGEVPQAAPQLVALKLPSA